METNNDAFYEAVSLGRNAGSELKDLNESGYTLVGSEFHSAEMLGLN